MNNDSHYVEPGTSISFSMQCYSGIYQYAVNVSTSEVFKRNVNSSTDLGEAFNEVTLQCI